MKRYVTRATLAPWVATAVLFGLWEGFVRVFGIAEFILPTPTATFAALFEFWGPIWQNAFQTCSRQWSGMPLRWSSGWSWAWRLGRLRCFISRSIRC